MKKNMKEIIERERLIGQQILLVRILHVENEKGFSFVKVDDIAKWMDISKDEVEAHMWACRELDYSQICFSATVEFCRDSRLVFDVRFFCEVYGLAYLKFVLYKDESELKIWIKKIKERYWEKYQEKYGKVEISDEKLEEAFEFFGKYYLNTIEEVRKCGFGWDVILEILEHEFRKEEILALSLMLNNRKII